MSKKDFSISGRFPFAYPIADAGLHLWFSNQKRETPFPWKRRQLTSGSCEYSWSVGPQQYTATLTVLPNDSTTHCTVSSPQEGPEIWLGLLCFMAAGEIKKLTETPEVVISPAPGLREQMLQRLHPSQQKRRRRTKDYNDRARARIAANEDREAVYRDWLIDRGEDANNKEIWEMGKDAFRKALSRKGRTDN